MTKVTPEQYWAGPADGPTPASHLPVHAAKAPRCDGCRFWITSSDDKPEHYGGPNWDRPEGWGECYLAEGGGEAHRPKHGVPTLAWAGDASSYHAVLYTAPDFGCVQFQAKP